MPSCYTGVLAAACTQGKRTQHGKPQGEVSDDQPNAREGQVGRHGVAERFVLPLRPGNSGGGPFPPPELPGLSGNTNLSATPWRPTCPSRASGWSSLTSPWCFPCCVRFPCVHAAANTRCSNWPYSSLNSPSCFS